MEIETSFKVKSTKFCISERTPVYRETGGVLVVDDYVHVNEQGLWKVRGVVFLTAEGRDRNPNLMDPSFFSFHIENRGDWLHVG